MLDELEDTWIENSWMPFPQIEVKISKRATKKLICPVCKSAKLIPDSLNFVCANVECHRSFPVVDGIPILINESNSVFAFEDYTTGQLTTMDLRDDSDKHRTLLQKTKNLLSKLVPTISRSIIDFSADDAMRKVEQSLSHPPTTLIVGSGDSELDAESVGELVYSDVAIGRLTQLVCDAHDLPFPDGYFDSVIAVAVLEHVADPYRCVDEIHRVLKPDGFVYAITPFMQQVHMGPYDFTRFTHLGHRRLFRKFTEERSGVANAQGMALSWAIERYVCGFSENHRVHSILRSVARVIASPFLVFDRLLAAKSGAFDSASAYYFFGRRAEEALGDRELVRGYRGMYGRPS